MFPDLSKDGKAFELWSSKAKELNFKVSDLLEKLAPETDKNKGCDLADYLIKQDWQLFKKQPPPPEPEKSVASVVSEAPKINIFSHVAPLVAPLTKVEVFEIEQPENWNNEIDVLEDFFKELAIEKQLIQLDASSTITDVPIFVKSHLTTVKANNGNKRFLPYLNRLQNLKQVLIN